VHAFSVSLFFSDLLLHFAFFLAWPKNIGPIYLTITFEKTKPIGKNYSINATNGDATTLLLQTRVQKRCEMLHVDEFIAKGRSLGSERRLETHRWQVLTRPVQLRKARGPVACVRRVIIVTCASSDLKRFDQVNP